MVLTETDYLRQLQALLPPGPAWQKDDNALLTRLLSGLSVELSRVDGRAWQIAEEADPRTVLNCSPTGSASPDCRMPALWPLVVTKQSPSGV